MAELRPFIQSLVKKWRLEGRTFTLGHFPLGLAFIQRLALKASFLAFAFTVHAFYNVYVG